MVCIDCSYRGDARLYHDILEGCVKHSNDTCSGCRKLSDIESKIEDTRRLLERLLEERASIMADLNEHHDPFINLPVEIASRVFVHCKPLTPSSFDPRATLEVGGLIKAVMTPGQVCRTWRRIAQSTPELWSTLCATITPSNCATSIDVVSGWLRRSGTLPLFLQIRICSSYRSFEDYTANLQKVITSVTHNAHRWEVLDMDIPSSFLLWMSTTLLNKKASSLRHLRFSISGKGEEVLYLNASPRWLTYDGPVSRINVNREQLTHVYVCRIETLDAIELFRSALLLEFCQITEIADKLEHLSTEPFVVAPSLVSLLTQAHSGEFWDHFLFPSLKILETFHNHNDEGPSSWNRLQALLRRSGCQLQDLTIWENEGLHDDLAEVLRLTPDLGRLSINGFIISEPFFATLEAAAIPREMQPTPFLNKLHSLSLDPERQFQWASLVAFLNSIGSRPERSLQSFNLKLRLWYHIIPDEIGDIVDKDTFKHMMDLTAGSRFEISGVHLDGDLLDLLRRHHGV